MLSFFWKTADVFAHRLDVHRADAELAVTRLPREIGIRRVLVLDPTRGRTLCLLDNLGGRMVFGLRKQDVGVISDGIDFDERRIVVLENTGDKGVELATFLIAKEPAAALRAEHEMDNDIGKGLRHAGVALTGLAKILGSVYLGLRSRCSLQPRLSHCGLSARD